MFGGSEYHLNQMLGRMVSEAHHACNANRVEAEKKVAEFIRQDRRFDPYDAERLAKRVGECGQNGSRLDLSDPYLRKGGEPRPQNRRGMW